jgi:diguanylate cyclase (GGDEF)-like protein
VWWVQDDHRHAERREVAMRLDALETLMEASGHVVAEGAGLWERLQRAEGIARSDPNGSGALSRAGLDEELATVAAPYAIAFVDLDGLRDFNASSGNWQAGDAALATLVQVLRTCARDTIVGRWGGDEFFVVLPGLDGPTALDRMTRALHSEVRVSDLPLTFTAGIAAVATADGLQAATAVAKAAVRHLKDTGSRATVLLAENPPTDEQAIAEST